MTARCIAFPMTLASEGHTLVHSHQCDTMTHVSVMANTQVSATVSNESGELSVENTSAACIVQGQTKTRVNFKFKTAGKHTLTCTLRHGVSLLLRSFTFNVSVPAEVAILQVPFRHFPKDDFVANTAHTCGPYKGRHVVLPNQICVKAKGSVLRVEIVEFPTENERKIGAVRASNLNNNQLQWYTQNEQKMYVKNTDAFVLKPTKQAQTVDGFTQIFFRIEDMAMGSGADSSRLNNCSFALRFTTEHGSCIRRFYVRRQTLKRKRQTVSVNDIVKLLDGVHEDDLGVILQCTKTLLKRRRKKT